MRPTSAEWRYLIRSSQTPVLEVTSWYDGKPYPVPVPVLGGTATFDDTAQLRRRLVLNVPARTALHDWDPALSATAPLGAYGQRLHVRAGLRRPDGTDELMDLGWYLIADWGRSATDGSIEVAAVDLVELLRRARLYAPLPAPPGATYADGFRLLVGGILPLSIDAAVVDRPLPAGTLWERERDVALDALARAWGVRWYVDDGGTIQVAPQYPEVDDSTVPDFTLVDGYDSTVVDRQRSAETDRLYNAVVATGRVPEGGGAAPYAVAEITDPASPIRVDGPFGRRPRFLASDILTDQSATQAAAETLLRRVTRVARADVMSVIPDPAIQLGDVGRVQVLGSSFIGRVTSYTLPLTVDGGAATMTVANTPRDDDSGGA